MDLPINKPLKDWSFEDIIKLVDNGVDESRTLDFKLQPHLNQGPGTKKKKSNNLEFCKDISAFANTLGGILIYGVSEKKDRKEYGKYPGFNLPPDKDFASFKQDLLDVLVGNLEPKIPESLIEFQPIPFLDESLKYFMVIKIFQSPLAPHAFKKKEKEEDGEKVFGRGYHFHHRTGTTNPPMEIQQIREAFVNTESRHEKIKKTLRERASLAANHKGPYKISDRSLWTLQIAPLYHQASLLFLQPQALFKLAEDFQNKSNPHRQYRFFLDIDGLTGLMEIKKRDNPNNSIIQMGYSDIQEFIRFYRDGSLEIVKQIQLEKRFNEESFMFSYYSKDLIETLKKGSFFLKQAEIPLPYFFSISFHGVESWKCRFELPEKLNPAKPPRFPAKDIFYPVWEMDKIPESEQATMDLLREFFMLFYQSLGIPLGIEDLKNLDKKQGIL